jgi:malate dehydrogenase (oxaloacetate-decarboxylating)
LDRDQEYKKKALELHRRYRGKISISLKLPIVSTDDFNALYTPGVAEISRQIEKSKDEVFNLTNKENLVAIVTDGTRVLGLGDIGPEAALPVMEGKALLFKYLGDVDAFPLCVNSKDASEIIDFVKMIAPTFGGINLEDISSPKCFEICDQLSSELDIPVFHDDQHGTSVVVLAALFNAMKLVNKKLEQSRITIIGAGAAGTPTARLLLHAGASPSNILVCDRSGIISKGRVDLDQYKKRIAMTTNDLQVEGDIRTALKGADV